jgi:hypothetical protein
VSATNYGLYFNMGSLSGSIYANALLFGVFRAGASVIMALCDKFVKKCGRRALHTFGVATFILCLIVISLAQTIG